MIMLCPFGSSGSPPPLTIRNVTMFAKSLLLHAVTRMRAPGLGRGHLGMGSMICLLMTVSSQGQRVAPAHCRLWFSEESGLV